MVECSLMETAPVIPAFVASYASPLGGITLASDGLALTGLWFDGQRHDRATLGDQPTVRQDLPVFHRARAWLDLYFRGTVPPFTPPLLIHGSDFRRLVATIMLDIPFGRTTTYGTIAREVARRTGRPHISAQAVGQAVGRNPIALIVPCHRVVGHDGRLTGYAGGLERKQWLLKHEKRTGSSL